MTCSRGAAHPDAATQKRLFAASAGYCQNPRCARELFVDADGKPVHVAEMAHVFAASDAGPRADARLTEAERGAFDNLVLLCANCHTIVDKAPHAYPDEEMLRWKREHAAKLAAIFGVVQRSSRVDARADIEPLLAQNRAVFDQYGPHVPAASDPESGAAEHWRRKLLTRIMPNNSRLLAILDMNRPLLHEDERATLERFRQHVDDLELVHVAGMRMDGLQFPGAMSVMLEDR